MNSIIASSTQIV